MSRWPFRFTLVLACLALATSSRAQAVPDRPRVKALTVVVLSTMLADTKGIGEWGFSALVEADGRRVLVDTGHRPETVLINARELGVDLSQVEDVVLTHHHGDHTGGLLALRRALMKTNPKALSRVHVGKGLFLSRPDEAGKETNEILEARADFEATRGRFVEVDKPTALIPGVWLTGPVPRAHPERNWSGRSKIRTSEGMADDTLPEDMSLAIDTDDGLVVITGCGHAGVVNTVEYARAMVRDAPVRALIGGIHLFPADAHTLDWTATRLRAAGLGSLLGAHCTGVETVYVLRGKLGLDRSACVVGAVGSGFDLTRGIRPGTIAR